MEPIKLPQEEADKVWADLEAFVKKVTALYRHEMVGRVGLEQYLKLARLPLFDRADIILQWAVRNFDVRVMSFIEDLEGIKHLRQAPRKTMSVEWEIENGKDQKWEYDPGMLENYYKILFTLAMKKWTPKEEDDDQDD